MGFGYQTGPTLVIINPPVHSPDTPGPTQKDQETHALFQICPLGPIEIDGVCFFAASLDSTSVLCQGFTLVLRCDQ
jgi:hypothetical protein